MAGTGSIVGYPVLFDESALEFEADELMASAELLDTTSLISTGGSSFVGGGGGGINTTGGLETVAP